MISIKLLGLSEELESNDKEFINTVNSLNAIQALDAVTDLKAATPVDTGRARNSWVLSDREDYFINSLVNSDVSALGSVRDDKIVPLYVTNGTPYIESLNEGSSKQAPARFVETTLLSKNYNVDGVLFETINLDEL